MGLTDMDFRLLQRNFSLRRLLSPLDYKRFIHLIAAWSMSKTLRITKAPEFRFRPEPAIYVDGVLLDYEPACAGGVLNMDADGPWEPEETHLIVESLKDGGVFYDIGANIGWHSINVALKTPATVVCFEPQPQRLRKNLALNHADCMVIEVALGSYNGAARMTAGYNAQNFITHTGDLKVPIRTLDSLVSEHHLPPPTFMKLDVEGFEHEVLHGARGTLIEYRPSLLCEITNLSDRYDAAGNNILSFLSELGYTLSRSYVLSHGRLGSNSLFTVPTRTNAVAR